MKQWRLTPQAENKLVEIAKYTLQHFGQKQALVYRDELINCIERLAKGEPPHARSCSVLSQDETDNLLHYKQGSHYIVFRQTDTQLDVLEFFHERMDLPKHLNNLMNT